MSKIICDVCGSRYPDTAVQCPICGSINSKAAKAAEQIQEPAVKTELPARTPTPGGRFSKANVNKRNQGKPMVEEPEYRTKPVAKREKPPVQDDYDLEEAFEEETGKKRGGFINVLLVIIIIALLGVCAYLFIQFFMPSFFGSEPIIAPTEPTVAVTEAPVETSTEVPAEAPTEAPEPTLPPIISCEQLTQVGDPLVLTEVGQTQKLNIQAMPENTTDGLIFISSNENVATVDESGVVTAVGGGNVVITVFCGAQQLECNVTCNFDGSAASDDTQTDVEGEAATNQTGEEKTVTSENLNIRQEPGAKKKKVGAYSKGDVITIFEQQQVGTQYWGRTDKGWVCMDYVK